MGGHPGYPAHALWWGAPLQAQAAIRSPIRTAAAYCSTVDLPQHPLIAECAAEQGQGHHRHPLGWQPSRFLADRAEAERDFAWAKRPGSINATAAELGDQLAVAETVTRYCSVTHQHQQPARP
jgi:hypothetical protein